VSDLAFEQLLAQHNDAYRSAEEFSDWMPPDGEYIATVMKSAKGVSTKDGVSVGWWKITGRLEVVEDPELNGREFPVGFYRTSTLGVLKSQVRALNGGKSVDSLAEADRVISESVGKVVKVKIVTTTSKKDGNDYTNCYVKEVLPITASGEDQTAPPPGAVVQYDDGTL